jgi:hypothetical protein
MSCQVTLLQRLFQLLLFTESAFYFLDLSAVNFLDVSELFFAFILLTDSSPQTMLLNSGWTGPGGGWTGPWRPA